MFYLFIMNVSSFSHQLYISLGGVDGALDLWMLSFNKCGLDLLESMQKRPREHLKAKMSPNI